MSKKLGDLYVDLRFGLEELQKDVKKATKQFNTVDRSVKKQTKSFGDLRASTVRTIRQLETLYVAYMSITTIMNTVVVKGIELNKMYEDQAIGIAALTSSKTKMYDANSKELDGYTQFLAAQQMTTAVMDDIKRASLDTPASFQQMLGFYQQAIGHTITANKTFGKSLEEVNKNTILFTQRMSAMGSAVGMEMPKINEEIRSLLSGNASTDSLLASMLFGSPSEANKVIKEAKTRAGGLSEVVLGALEPFKHVEGVMTYSKAMAQLNASLDDLRKSATGGLFEDIKNSAIALKEYIYDNMDRLTTELEGAYGVIRGQVAEIGDMWVNSQGTIDSIGDSFYGVSSTLSNILLDTISVSGTFDDWNDSLSQSEKWMILLDKGTTYFHIGVNSLLVVVYELEKALNAIKNIWVGIYDSITTGSTQAGKDAERYFTLAKDMKTRIANNVSVEDATAIYREQKKALDEELAGRKGVVKAKQDSLDIDKKQKDLIDGILKLEKNLSKEVIDKNRDKRERVSKEIPLLKNVRGASGVDELVKANDEAVKNAGEDLTMLKRIAEETRIAWLKMEALDKVSKVEMQGGITKEDEKKKPTSGSSRTAELNEEISLLAIQAELNKASLELELAKSGLVATEYQENQALANVYEAQAKESKKTYELAVKRAKLVKVDASTQKKLLALKLKAIKDETKAERQKNRQALKFQKDMKSVGDNLADSIIAGDIKGVFESLTTDIMNVFIDPLKDAFSNLFGSLMKDLLGGFYENMTSSLGDWAAESIATNMAVGSSDASLAVLKQGTIDPASAFPRMALMAAAVAALGFSTGAIGGGNASISKSSMPTYEQAVKGADQKEQGFLGYNGVTMGLSDYNRIIEIATERQISFNKAISVYNRLEAEAHEIWTRSTSSLRKWGYELTTYTEALDASNASGGFEALNEFWSNTASEAENIEFLNRELENFSKVAGYELPLSVEEAKSGIQAMIDMFYKTGELKYMQQANKLADAGNAAFKLQEAQQKSAEKISSCMKRAAEEAKRAAEEWARTLVDIAGLRAEWIGGEKGAKLYLDAVTTNTGLTGLTNENFLAKFTEASKNGLSTEDFEKWSNMSSAIQAYADALEEVAQKQIDAVNVQIDFYSGILSDITSAYTGALSYFNSMEKADYYGRQAKIAIQGGDSTSYFSALSKQLEYEKKMSVTKEAYMPLFNEYIDELKLAEPEKTTDDVVESLDSLNKKLDEVKDAIEQSAYQGAL